MPTSPSNAHASPTTDHSDSSTQSCGDQTATLHGAVVQYGKHSDRIYLMKINSADPMTLLPELDRLAEKENLGKIFAKVPARIAPVFQANGYVIDATIPLFYNGSEDGIFLGKYLQASRQQAADIEELDRVLDLARKKVEPQAGETYSNTDATRPLPAQFRFRYCRECDAEEVSAVYKEVFASYPFSIDDPAYIRQTMKENVLYFSIRNEGKIIALSSAEIDWKSANAEMTDFATLPEYRGYGLACFLLAKMERAMKKLGIKTAYTIARAISPGMNITFSKGGYHYGGRLINNTQISGTIESMNIWYKTL